jgi:hypothetical protein
LSIVFIGHLRAGWRRLELLSDEATEQLQSPLAILLGKDLPEPVQGEVPTPNRCRRKRGRAVLPGMVHLLASRYDRPGTNRRASKKQKPILPESQARVDPCELQGSGVCPFCNRYKGDRTVATDPETGAVLALFHPRRQRWSDHFVWSEDGLRILGRTPTGRATVAALHLDDDPDALIVRSYWVLAGWHPPSGE